MAEALFADLVRHNGKKDVDWRIASAGVWAYNGMPATSKAVNAMRERGLDLRNHHSQGVSDSLLERFNLVLCMTQEHKQNMRRNFPKHAAKIFLLGEMVDDRGEIDDPVGLSAQVYQSTADEMLGLLQRGYDKIFRLSA